MELEWDPWKEEQNVRKHGVSFAEAATVLGDPLSETVHDPAHSDDEDRYLTVGRSAKRRLLPPFLDVFDLRTGLLPIQLS